MLEKIKSPADIRKLSFANLKLLAKAVRKRIIEVTSKNGGHLAPSLGATDIAIALLKVFDPLKDRIVWDVGHQSYAYKILTERNSEFDTLRQFNGMSGFNNIFESKYDAFGVGHSSTSISAALGICVGKELNNEDGRAIAIIGDGALTSGMSFEAMNHTGHLQKELIVILNDNEMSISPNVGALQKYLTNMLVSRSYNSLKKQVWDGSKNLPNRLRRKFIYAAQKIEESLINILVPNIIFEDLGFKYIGPVDGHDIVRLVRIFNKVNNNVQGPVLIHVVTQKGRGCDFAEMNATKFHGLGPFERKTGNTIGKSVVKYSNVFGKTLCDLAAKNDKIVAITSAMTDGTGLIDFAKKFPNQFFDVGIAEQHAVTFAGGIAIQKIKPFVAIYSTFLQRAFDQIVHDIALQKLPVVFCLDRAGLVGDDGATHHGVFDLSYLQLIPNMTIMAPASGNELSLMLHFAERYFDGPIAIRYPRGEAHFIENDVETISYGKSHLYEDGQDIALIGAGKAFQDVLTLSKIIKKEFPKINPIIINPLFIKPLDAELLNEIKGRVKHIITIEDNAISGGFGEAIGNFYNNDNIKIHRFGIPDKFVTHGTVEQLKNLLKITPEQIFLKIKPILYHLI